MRVRDPGSGIQDSGSLFVPEQGLSRTGQPGGGNPRMSLSPILVTPGHTRCSHAETGDRHERTSRGSASRAAGVLERALFAAAAVLTLALGIGVNIAVFTVMHSALLAGLPVKHAKDLVNVFSWSPKGRRPHRLLLPALRRSARQQSAARRARRPTPSMGVGVAAGPQTERVITELVTVELLSRCSASTCRSVPASPAPTSCRGAAPGRRDQSAALAVDVQRRSRA